ncbi:hypothetical protein PIN31115_04532 [Pandoraea iniqua]|uniref:Internalin-A n=1 Tax=Pandoraea iniqua TaxID=2508288 RepID=A0A5E4YIN4_9BURK|nr:hypothetical protein [Pandoraea iniqua]VVE48601.1 hypothetical protein PIN31115_04532 [Pandoraea iniqua]
MPEIKSGFSSYLGWLLCCSPVSIRLDVEASDAQSEITLVTRTKSLASHHDGNGKPGMRGRADTMRQPLLTRQMDCAPTINTDVPLPDLPHTVQQIIIQNVPRTTRYKAGGELALVNKRWNQEVRADMRSITIKDPQGLAKLGDYPKVTHLQLSGEFRDEHLANLPQNLLGLDLSQCKGITLAGLKPIADLRHLLSLNLSRPRDASAVEIKGCVAMFAQHPTLTEVHLNGCGVDDNEVQALTANPRIKTLTLDRNEKITIVGLQALVGCSTLETLGLAWIRVIASHVELLAQHATLKKLDLTGIQIQVAGAAALSQMKTLTELNVSYGKLSDDSIAQLAHSGSLQRLTAGHNELTGRCCLALAENTSLVSLDLSSSHLHGEFVEHLAKMANLHTLNISDNYVGDNGAIALAGAKSLRVLFLVDSRVRNEGVKALAKSRSLETLYLANNPFTEQGLRALIDSPSIKRLGLYGMKMGRPTLGAFLESRTLQHLDVRQCGFHGPEFKQAIENSRIAEILT